MSQNIFEIWDSIGRRTPFAVRRDNWNKEYYTIVDKVDCAKLPYGKAFGGQAEFTIHQGPLRETVLGKEKDGDPARERNGGDPARVKVLPFGTNMPVPFFVVF
ncbi:hypothetical protein KJS94_16405 [Flavihumibacter rivuli]|uniref:hypothetical protein n=1 Tax=Flavihumibacter rivuli TaxID=2838156 RepID=UPI001BDDCCFC|nr:hypothetical protein [Flavihumibacter rivuli]ULQ56233.1 hypothetical protein KJS94_16405 [Flavihumibacter rivuli]